MAQLAESEWTPESMQCCIFPPRRESVRRCALIQPRFWEAARLRWPNSPSRTRSSQTAVGDQTHRTFWSALKKRTEHWFGMGSSRASGNWSRNLKPRTKFIPASQTRFNKQPENLKQVEICSRSGLLATDKCYDALKTANSDTVQRHTTYMEIATPSQAPTEPCNVHGEPRARLAREFPASDLPRAALAVDL